ncbi:hypothetical protein KPZU09_42570 [Klebsiella pneumoniae]|uniref:FAD dependent oxidoreductase domain-containing protein n=1 Tax=Klebsiella pneumoniae TaxID=573 RepID=A0A919LPJ7_KLEPN|nr:hypothetical protein KPZU09_42570 [Klebsiella pneumoniae]
MLDRARHFVPALATLNIIRCWSGLRAASQDGNPLIGPHPARRGVWLALGHEGLGVTTAPATAELLAAQILDERSPLAPDARSRYVCVNRRRLHEGHSQHHRRWPASDGAGRISVAAALALTGDPTTRRAVNGELRAPFCGMGVCRVPDRRRRPSGAGLSDPVPGRYANRKEPR